MFYVAYSGGKDSIVMLDIVQRALPHDGFVVVFMIQQWSLRPRIKLYQMQKLIGLP